MKYDLQKRIFMLRSFYQFGSIFRVQRAYCAKFNVNSKLTFDQSPIDLSIFEDSYHDRTLIDRSSGLRTYDRKMIANDLIESRSEPRSEIEKVIGLNLVID